MTVENISWSISTKETGVEPATSWSPVGRRIQLSHRGRPSGFEEEKCIYKGSLLFGGEVLNIFIECNKKKYHYFHECEARVKKWMFSLHEMKIIVFTEKEQIFF